MTLFTGHNLTCIRSERCVFAGLNFALDRGGALILTGPNGSGKSSLLRLMAGLLDCATGALAWAGAAVAGDPEAHNARLHYVGHLDAVKPVLSVAENVGFWAALHAGNRAEHDIHAALDAVGMGHLADVPARFLSAGQKRRVALARLAAAPVPLWLLDEPTTALDTQSITALGKLIARHRAGGGMVAVATHSELPITGGAVLDMEQFAVRPGEDVLA